MISGPLSITVLEERSATLARLETLAEIDPLMPLHEAMVGSAPPVLPARDTQPCTVLPDAEEGGL